MAEQDSWVDTLKSGIRQEAFKCWNCNFCYSYCPLYKSMKGFMVNGPSGLTQSIYYALNWNLLGNEFRNEILNILYSCTTCNSCVLTCKDFSAGIKVVEIIEQGRKLLLEMMIGPVAGHKKVLESLIKYGNPYEKPATKRLDWLKELEKDKRLTYKKIPGDAQTDTLLFVGCTASFEDNIQKVARSMVLLLERAKARYGILDEETCCGSPSRRIGDEGLFGELSETVTRVINEAGLSHIVTISPHCYNTFKHEYPEPFRKLNIQHYTEYLSEMIETGKLSPQKKIKKTITFHDPCYLGKRNGVYDAPRKILSAIPGIKLVEMESNKGNSLCCGGGGGRMWIEVDEVRRMSHIRLEEALNTSAEIIATACPWCNIQLEDAIRTSDNEGKIEVKDISELLLSSLS